MKRYLNYDVFTNKRFSGNRLAVLLDARGFASATMQHIANEMNFSETTFLLPPEHEDTHARMRIFTPAAELPMAGHPTMGSTFALAHEGIITPGTWEFVFGLGIRPTPVAMEWIEDSLAFLPCLRLDGTTTSQVWSHPRGSRNSDSLPGSFTAAQTIRLLSLQGVKMGRPSTITISLTTSQNAIPRVRVGGAAVLVGEGTIIC